MKIEQTKIDNLQEIIHSNDSEAVSKGIEIKADQNDNVNLEDEKESHQNVTSNLQERIKTNVSEKVNPENKINASLIEKEDDEEVLKTDQNDKVYLKDEIETAQNKKINNQQRINTNENDKENFQNNKDYGLHEITNTGGSKNQTSKNNHISEKDIELNKNKTVVTTNNSTDSINNARSPNLATDINNKTFNLTTTTIDFYNKTDFTSETFDLSDKTIDLPNETVDHTNKTIEYFINTSDDSKETADDNNKTIDPTNKATDDGNKLSINYYETIDQSHNENDSNKTADDGDKLSNNYYETIEQSHNENDFNKTADDSNKTIDPTDKTTDEVDKLFNNNNETIDRSPNEDDFNETADVNNKTIHTTAGNRTYNYANKTSYNTIKTSNNTDETTDDVRDRHLLPGGQMKPANYKTNDGRKNIKSRHTLNSTGQSEINKENESIDNELITIQSVDPISWRYTFYITCLLISIPFFALTLIVYWILPQLNQSDHGKSTMCYLLSVMVAYMMLAVTLTFGQSLGFMCTVFGYMLHFCILAITTWLNVMCFDILWAFSVLENKNEFGSSKFKKYGIYAWGLPAAIVLMTLFLAALPVDNQYLPDLGGDLCFYQKESTQWLYCHGPTSVLMTANVLMFLGTSCVIFNHTRQIAVLTSPNSARSKAQKRWYRIYSKLFFVTGMNWIAELLSLILDHENATVFFFVTDSANVLLGVIVFLILVCHKRVINGLRRWWRDDRMLNIRQKSTFASTLTRLRQSFYNLKFGSSLFSQTKRDIDLSPAMDRFNMNDLKKE